MTSPIRLVIPLRLSALMLGALAVAACDDAAEPGPTGETPELVSLGLQASDTLEVELLAEDAPAVGLNRVYYRLTRAGGEAVTAATLTQTPIMHMQAMGKEHGCPVEQPPAQADADGLFPAIIVFQMASGEPGSGDAWRVELAVDLGEGAPSETFVFADLPVAASDARRDLALTDPMGSPSAAVVTLHFDQPPRVGLNTFTVTMHHKTDMHGMSWMPDDDCAITVTPDMPSMGHGSTHNVDPVHVGNGRYEGTVNFTMPGLWRVVFDFSRDGAPLGAVEYTVAL